MLSIIQRDLTCSKQSLKHQRGVALLMVLFALALVATGLPVILQQGRAELSAQREVYQLQQAKALHQAAQLLVEEGMTSKGWRQNPLFWRTLQGEWLEVPVAQLGGDDLPGTRISVRLKDMRACFNVNQLAGKHAQAGQAQLLYWLSMRDSRTAQGLVQRLSDWLDEDMQAQPQGAEAGLYARQARGQLPANGPMSDSSEINLVLPRDSGRIWQHPALCAWQNSEPWRLNVNALKLQDLPLLESLFVGELSSSMLRRLLLSRPATGYASANDVRAVLQGLDETSMSRVLDALVLNSERYEVETRVKLNGQEYAFTQGMKLEGVSRWAAQVPAQRVTWLAVQRPFN